MARDEVGEGISLHPLTGHLMADKWQDQLSYVVALGSSLHIILPLRSAMLRCLGEARAGFREYYSWYGARIAVLNP